MALANAADYDHTVRPEELSVIGVLRGAAIESVWGVIEHCPVLAPQRDEVLVDAGDKARRVYLVVSGSLWAYRVKGGVQGRTATLGPGSMVGEMAMLEGSPAPCRVIAAEKSRVIMVDEESFWRLVGVSHAFAANVLSTVAGRLQKRIAVAGESGAVRPALELGVSVDGLTGFAGRDWLAQMAPRMVNRYSRDRRPLSVLLVDVDHLKRINDMFGQQAGDLVLTSLGRILRWCLRPTDISARCGGEEFCVILPGASRDGARAAAERLRQTVLESQITSEEGAPVPPVSLSIGIAELTPGADAGALLKAAEAALARVKESGGGHVGW